MIVLLLLLFVCVVYSISVPRFRDVMDAAIEKVAAKALLQNSPPVPDYTGMRNFSLGTNPMFQSIYLGRCANLFDEMPSLR
jgi:hypothetical protein